MKSDFSKGLLVIGVLALSMVFVMSSAAGGGRENITGSGRIVSEDFDFRGFTKLDVSHAFRVDVIQAESYSVTVKIDDNLQRHLRVEKRGDMLFIGLKPHLGLNLRGITMEAVVRMPELSGVEASGASDVRISGFSRQRDLRIECSGASSLEGEISAADVRLKLSGASNVWLHGEADTIDIEASGASDADLEDFPVTDAVVQLSGASEAYLVLDGTLDIDASGASRLLYEGNPTISGVELSGASSIKRR